jgi:SNF family Na+-dependent transporter
MSQREQWACAFCFILAAVSRPNGLSTTGASPTWQMKTGGGSILVPNHFAMLNGAGNPVHDP